MRKLCLVTPRGKWLWLHRVCHVRVLRCSSVAAPNATTSAAGATLSTTAPTGVASITATTLTASTVAAPTAAAAHFSWARLRVHGPMLALLPFGMSV